MRLLQGVPHRGGDVADLSLRGRGIGHVGTHDGDLAKVPIKSYAEYDADMQESVSKKKDIVDQMADLNLNDIEYGSADYEKLQDLHSKMSDIDSPTLDQSDLQKAAKEADLSGSLKDLETTLSEKIK